MLKKITPIAMTLLLSGCVTATNAPSQSSTNSSVAARAGYDSAKGERQADRRNYDGVVDAGLAAGMTRDLGAGGLGLGVLGWLAGSSDTMWSDPSLLVTPGPSANRNAIATRYGELVYKVSGQQLETKGYTRVQNPNYPTIVTFIQLGCPMTSRGYYQKSCAKTFWATVIPTKDASTLKLMPGMSAGIGDLESFNRRVMALAPNEVSLFLPPKKVGGQVQPARLIHKGKETRL